MLGLMRLPRIGDAAIHRILQSLDEQGSELRFLREFSASDLVDNGLLSEEQAECFVSEAEHAWRETVIDELESGDIRLIPITSPRYPAHLRERAPGPPPALLTVFGAVDLLDRSGIAFAGARNVSEPGIGVTRRLVGCAVEQGFSVVSGGARGTDAVAHQEAIERGGSTIVVLAEGILSSRARLLVGELGEEGLAVVSTLLPDQSWQAWSAMQRNRTILGLSDRLVVIEAAEEGGSIAAGQLALKHAVTTWVIGYADPPETATGNRLLIDEGARSIPVSAEGEVQLPLELYAREG